MRIQPDINQPAVGRAALVNKNKEPKDNYEKNTFINY